MIKKIFDKQDIIDWLHLDVCSYREIGDMYGVSKQRISQIRESAKRGGEVFHGRMAKYKAYSEHERRVDRLVYTAKSRELEKNPYVDKRLLIQTEDFLPLPEFCPVLGIKINYDKKKSKEGRLDSSPSVDKIIPEKGYVKGNVRIISWRANRIKNNGTYEEHIKIAEYMKRELEGTH